LNDKPEVEEEANFNVNNGLPLIKEYENLIDGTHSGRATPFFIIQFIKKSQHKKGEKCLSYKIDVFLTSVHLFYNRTLISRA